MAHLLTRALALTLLLSASNAGAHDPSAYGGLFRSRDVGGVWLNADIGLFLSAALSVATNPQDSNELLMGTDLGLMRSRSGGRSWTPEAQGLILGAVFAVAFSPDGRAAVCAAPSGVFRLDAGGWATAKAPSGATPARAVAYGAEPDRVYLLGRDGLFVSGDGGRSYGRSADALAPGTEITALSVAIRPREVVLVVAGGRLMASEDGGTRWSRRDTGLDGGPVDAVVADPSSPGRLWAASGNRIHVSDDLGHGWRVVGRPLPDAAADVRGIAADPEGTTLVVTTSRGMYRSEDGGRGWALKEGNLPVHLEAGPLARDPGDARTLYAVFSLVPYPDVWRTALEGRNLLARSDPVSLAGGLAFVLLLIVGGGLLVRWLARRRGAGASAGWSTSS